jgi:hypothetical protein
MAQAKATDVELAENISRALPVAEAPTKQTLPMVIAPNWVATELTIEGALVSLGFTPWELKFFGPALEGVSVQMLLPYGNEIMALNFETKTLAAYVRPNNSIDFHDWDRKNAKIIPMHPDWVGTRSEIDLARKSIFEKNLARYLMIWGNAKFSAEWEKCRSWCKEGVITNLRGALKASCVSLQSPDFETWKSVHLYNQSPKHKTYNARCFFNVKKLPTNVARIYPKCSSDIIEVLGLDGEQNLPEFLRGWSRTLGWTTSSIGGGHDEVRWGFSDDRTHIFEVCVTLNLESLTPELQAHFAARSSEQKLETVYG